MIYFFLWFDSLLKDFSWGLLHGNFFFKGWWHLVASIDSNTHLYEVIRHQLFIGHDATGYTHKAISLDPKRGHELGTSEFVANRSAI